jgi:glycosyltransferase involved in cell wall biosynthesis
MKALVFTTTYPNPLRPTHGVFVQERIRHVAELCEVRVVAPVPWYKGRVPAHEERAGLEVLHPTYWYSPCLFKFTDPFTLFLSSLPTVRRLQRTFAFDLIDAHFTYPDGVAAVMLGQWFRKPVVITERGTLPQHARQFSHRAQVQWALRRAARVIAVSHELGEQVQALGAPPERVEVIPNGVDLERFQARDRGEARQRLGLPAAGRWLVSVGHLSPRKGFQRVLRVLPDLRRDHPDLRFAIVGGPGAEGNNGPELRRLIAELGLTDRVQLVGPQPPEEVAWWLAAADLFVLATDFEGCPNVVNEAMACGIPVVVSRVGEAERMVPNEAGMLVNDPNDGSELASRLRAALGRTWDRAAIRAAVAGRTWQAVAARVVEQWREALAPPRAAAPQLVEQ